MTFNTQINSTYKAYRTHNLDEELLNYIGRALFNYSGASILWNLSSYYIISYDLLIDVFY